GANGSASLFCGAGTISPERRWEQGERWLKLPGGHILIHPPSSTPLKAERGSVTRSGFAAWKAFGLDGSVSNIPTWLRLISRAPVGVLVAPLAKLSISVAGFSSLQHPELHAVGFEVSLQF